MENPQYEQLQLFYTQEEVDAKVSEVTRSWNDAVSNAYRNTSNDLRDRAIEWFKSEVRGGSMAKDDALGIFNGLADALGWELLDNLTSMYSVTVTVDDRVIGTFEGVEADDEQDACDKVTEELEAEMTIEVSYGRQTLTDTVYGWDLNVEAEAEEEE